MKILYIADGRSPIAINWIGYFIQAGNDVHLVSTYPCQTIPGIASFTVIPVGLSGFYGQTEMRSGQGGRFLRKFIPVGLRNRLRQWAAPFSFATVVNSLLEVIEKTGPELIHALRIPYEGMITALAYNQIETKRLRKVPFLISVWGNDFTLHAASSRKLADHTSQALRTCDALHTDCTRDMKMAGTLGFDDSKPRIILPGGGGIKAEIFYPTDNGYDIEQDESKTKKQSFNIINPRGFRAYVRNDTFFKAIPLVLEKYSDVHFICPSMDREPQASKWVTELGIGRYIELLPAQSQQGMAELFKHSQISLSITTHDGTPNTLLEAMACGCFPIAGDIESLRELITSGVNGLLVDPDDPKSLATAILDAITKPELRRQAREQNLRVVNERFEYKKVMQAAEKFYERLLSG